MSRLKSYIDGQLKFRDMMHPSKIQSPSSRTRTCITYFMNSHKYELFPDAKLKNWNRRAESKLAAYINGETTARDLVHPSKFPQLSEEVLRQKMQKGRLLQTQYRNNSQLSRPKSTDWIDLGKQFEAERVAHQELLLPRPAPPQPSTESTPGNDQTYSTCDLIPLNANILSKSTTDQTAVSGHEVPTNTVIFNGNVNILCFSVGAPTNQQSAERICDDVKRELQMLSTYTILPDGEQPALTTSNDDILDAQQLCCSTDTVVVEQPPNRMLQAVVTGAAQSNSNVQQELVAIVNELLPTVRTLRNQYIQALGDCKELTMERKILLKHQEISERTITLLSEETKELKERNEKLSESSESFIHQVYAETRNLSDKNQQLQRKLDELRLSEEELVDVNRNLIRELQLKTNERDDLRVFVANIKRNLHAKLANLDECFETIYECIEKTQVEVKQIQANSSCTEKQVLVNTIRRLDEQNSNLIGKVKHMPEKIKTILNHINGTMSSLEEQNIRLLRTLQNSENETFLENNFYSRIKT